MRIARIAACGAVLLISACGTNTTERASTSALTGAGVGALVGGPIGAAVGLGVGGAVGWAEPEGADQMAANLIHKERATSQTALNDAGLGQGSTAQPRIESRNGAEPSRHDAIKEAQIELKREDYYDGDIDGVVGPKTRKATSDFQQHAGLQQTARLDAPTMDALRQHMTAAQSNQPQEGSGSSTPPQGAQNSPNPPQDGGVSDNQAQSR